MNLLLAFFKKHHICLKCTWGYSNCLGWDNHCFDWLGSITRKDQSKFSCCTDLVLLLILIVNRSGNTFRCIFQCLYIRTSNLVTKLAHISQWSWNLHPDGIFLVSNSYQPFSSPTKIIWKYFVTPYASQKQAEESQNSSAIPALLGIQNRGYSIVKADDEVQLLSHYCIGSSNENITRHSLTVNSYRQNLLFKGLMRSYGWNIWDN